MSSIVLCGNSTIRMFPRFALPAATILPNQPERLATLPIMPIGSIRSWHLDGMRARIHPETKRPSGLSAARFVDGLPSAGRPMRRQSRRRPRGRAHSIGSVAHSPVRISRSHACRVACSIGQFMRQAPASRATSTSRMRSSSSRGVGGSIITAQSRTWPAATSTPVTRAVMTWPPR